MNIKDIDKKSFRPVNNLVALTWCKSKSSTGGVIIPDTHYKLGLRLGQYFIGEIIATSQNVTTIKVKDKILIPEYGIRNFGGTWKEGEIYFIEEENIKAKVSNVKGIIFRHEDEDALERVEDL